jgi:hypothetical protein
MVAGCNSYTLLIYEPYNIYVYLLREVLDSFYIAMNPALNMERPF